MWKLKQRLEIRRRPGSPVLLIAVTLCIATRWVAWPAGAEGTDPPPPAPPAEEAPESAVSSPPMEMDDPGTPGSLGVELNLVGALARAGHRHSGEGLLDANLGIGDRLQLKFERPYATEDGGGIEPQQGLGATKIGVKWRFIERNGLSLATYPAYQFDDAFTLNDENGDPEESEGRFFYLPVLVSKAVGHLYTVAGNYGYRRNLDSRGDTHFLGVGVGRAVSWWEGRIMGELISERDAHFHNLESAVGLGLAFLPFPKSFERLSFELPVYTSLHHTIGTTEDGASHTSLVFGMSFVLKPRR